MAHVPQLRHLPFPTGKLRNGNFAIGDAPIGIPDVPSDQRAPTPFRDAAGNGRPCSVADASMPSDDPGTGPARVGISAGEAGHRGAGVPGNHGGVATSAAVRGTRAAAAGTYADAHGSGADIFVRQAMEPACPCSAAGARW